MKTHTNDFKTNINKFGRELDSKITYGLVELGMEDLNSIVPSVQSSLLKSCMKQLDIDSNTLIPVGTILNYQLGVKVGNSYEYLDYGNYVVKEVEKQEDTNSYQITCYDKMLYSMKDYEDLGLTYPVSVRTFITALCTKLGLTFADANNTFVNYDKTIQSEPYLDADGNSLGYRYRDVFDELSQVVAGSLCLNSNDEVEVRYPNETNDTIDKEYLKDVNVKFGEKFGPINSVVLSRSAESDSIYQKDDASITLNGLTEIKIKDNQILNGNNRDEFLPEIFTELNGFEYYVNDYSSTGICYYDFLDFYTVNVGLNNYKTIMFNDEVNVTQGLEENIHSDIMEVGETDYSKADKTDRRINQAYIIVDKQNQEINSVVQNINTMQTTINNQGDQIDALGTRITQTVDNITASVTSIQNELDNGVGLVKTTTVTINDNGLTVATDTSKTATSMTSDKFTINSSGKELAFFGYDDVTNSTKAQMDNLTVTNYFVSGYHRTEKMDLGLEKRTGVFYVGE